MGFPFYQILFGSFALFASKWVEQNRNADMDAFLEKRNPIPSVQEYDFIVVGSGSSGAVVASKLSNSYSVLLLEAGGDPVPQSQVPLYWSFIYSNPDLAYQWKSSKQKHFGRRFDGHVPIAQGRSLGGSSSINYAMYNRGSPRDYDNWANLTGDPSWAYDSVLKHFKASESYTGPQNDHLGSGGLLTISPSEFGFNSEELRWMNLLMVGAQELGYKAYLEANSPQIEGFSTMTKTTRFGRRSSTWLAFLQPFESTRETLTISRFSVVEKVIFDQTGSKPRAKGVLYQRHGIQMYAIAKKEIVISAGTFNTPHILMHSGVGPKDDLEKAGIEVIIESPVGQFYQDHPSLIMTNVKFNREAYPDAGLEVIDNFIQNGKGPLANVEQSFGQAFLVSDEAKAEGNPDWPDFEFVFAFNSASLLNGSNNLVFYMLLGRPTSIGKVTLNPQDPKGQLIWDPNCVSTERDRKVVIQGMRTAMKLLETKAFQEIGISIDKTPGCEKFDYDSDEYGECWFRYGSATAWHPVGTCKMGREDDTNSVVDSKLRVKGVDGLRLIDNSIQPTIVNSNTNAAAIMIGQKGADMILEYWRDHDL